MTEGLQVGRPGRRGPRLQRPAPGGRARPDGGARPADRQAQEGAPRRGHSGVQKIRLAPFCESF